MSLGLQPVVDRIYSNPPVVEALCEFRFEPAEDDWDLTVPGKLHAALDDEYSGRPSDRAVLQASIDTDDEGQGVNITQSNRVMLPNGDGTRLIGIGPGVLSVHMLSPYHHPDATSPGGWSEFEPRIQVALGAYWDVAGPSGVVRTGLRYVNRIVTSESDASQYLVGAPGTPAELPVRVTGFLSRAEHAYDDGANIRIVQGYNSTPDGERGFLLDLDAFRVSDPALDKMAALSMVGDLHDRELVFFEALITDTARSLFNDD